MGLPVSTLAVEWIEIRIWRIATNGDGTVSTLAVEWIEINIKGQTAGNRGVSTLAVEWIEMSCP